VRLLIPLAPFVTHAFDDRDLPLYGDNRRWWASVTSSEYRDTHDRLYGRGVAEAWSAETAASEGGSHD
jgi:hypothetical protein